MANDLNAFMATMVGSSAPVAPDEAQELARDLYGLEVTAARLTGERDENFKLSCRDGSQYVLKISNIAEDPAVTDLPIAALLHIERVDPGFPCPRLLRDRDGRTMARYEDRTGLTRTVRVLTYLQGKTLRSSARSRAQRTACGRVAARLGIALRPFAHPAAHRPLIWDLRNVGRTLALLEELPAFPHRDAVAVSVGRIEARIASPFERLRQQVVHNDLNDMNVLVEPAAETVIAGVIDFGDLAHTALIADVAIAAADLIKDEVSPHHSILDLAIAYHETTPLLPPELSMLNSLIAGRLLMDLVIPSWHRARNPHGTHYADLDPESVRARLELARELLSRDMTL
ncbi:MAG: aminoglycoside phosphotransferase [Gammaproteobacteria bacterium]|nr:aminoglycoside phosphotransferase [Gammaproteobacteria bacterium]